MLLLRRLSFLISSSSLRKHFLKPSLFPLPLSPHPRLLHTSTRLSNGFFGKPNSRTRPVFCLKTNGFSYGSEIDAVHNDMLPRMIELNRKMQEVGLYIEFSIPGLYNNLLCPECNGGDSMEESLSLFIEQDWSSAHWMCFRGKCGWKGSTGGPAVSKPSTACLNQVAPKPQKIIREISEESLGLEPLTDEFQVLTYFAERLISKETLERNSVMQKRRYDGQVDIAFTYRHKGKLVGCKYWTADKDVWQEKDTEKIFYGLDDIEGESDIIIVEGEMDKLAMAEAGFHNCVSVPDGAPPSVSLKKLPPEDQDIKYQYLWNCKEYMKKASRIILATDGDAPGKALAVELARRIGRERCWRVQWPMKNETEHFKDANEVLMFLGPDALKEVIDCAEVDPIPGLLNSKMQEAGINMEASSPGRYNHLTCPECNGGDSMEKSFSLFIEQDWSFACWKCFQRKCGWKGSTGWLISKETLERDSVMQKRRFDNQREKREDQTEDIRMENGSTKENKSFSDGSISGYESLHRLLSANLKPQVFQEVSNLLLGLNCGKTVQGIALPESAKALSSEHDFDIQAFQFSADTEVMREPQIVRVGLIQNSIALPTTAPFRDQKRAIYQKLQPMIHAAGASGVNILCLQETWMMPFAFCTREKKWCELAEPVDGESTQFLQDLAKKYNMVIISPILERDVNHGETLWNTAVIIGNHGNIIGKHRKNHIPRIGDFNESTYYMEGNTGHPVFETAYGKIGVNICYGRHHPLNWLAFGLNGAEIVFNPSATVGQLSEPMWPIEARNAAIANSYFVGSINRVGTEVFPSPFTSGDGKPQHADFGHFYGSSHFSAPDASCTPSLSRCRDGLMISDMDLNLCRQLKDKWGFRMTARYELHAELLAQYMKLDFQPQVITDPSLNKKSS